MKRFAIAAAAAMLVCAAAPVATAQNGLGWLSVLGGSCWQGVDAQGQNVDRQCFNVQFNRFLRATITRGDLSGASVLGWNRARGRLELYAWSNRGQPTVYAPTFNGSLLVLPGESGRVVWRNAGDNFEIATQVENGGAWSDREVITYHRDGAAPAAFEATAANAQGGAQLGWIESLAGHCYHQAKPQSRAANRGCLAWEYPNILHETWYWGRPSATGESVMFRATEGIKFFYWDAQGNFGVGDSSWGQNAALYSTTDADHNRRTYLRGSPSGFTTTTEVRSGGSDRSWEFDHSVRLVRD